MESYERLLNIKSKIKSTINIDQKDFGKFLKKKINEYFSYSFEVRLNDYSKS
jgi:hypothetical protein